MPTGNMSFETSSSEVQGIPVVHVVGEVDVYTAPGMKAAINEVVAGGAKNVILDLHEVEYMDSSGFGVLLGITKRLRPQGGGISLVGCSRAIRRLLTITRLESIFAMYDTVDEAVAAVKQS